MCQAPGMAAFAARARRRLDRHPWVTPSSLAATGEERNHHGAHVHGVGESPNRAAESAAAHGVRNGTSLTRVSKPVASRAWRHRQRHGLRLHLRVVEQWHASIAVLHHEHAVKDQ